MTYNTIRYRDKVCHRYNPADEAEHYEYRPDYVFSKRRFAGGAEFCWEWQGEGKSVRALRHWSNLPNTEIRYQWNDTAGAGNGKR